MEAEKDSVLIKNDPKKPIDLEAEIKIDVIQELSDEFADSEKQTIKVENGSEELSLDAEPDLRAFRQLTCEILNLTFPIILSEVLQNTLPVVDLAFVGQLSKDDLGVAALGTVWFNLWDATLQGFCTAIDTLLSQAYGANDYDVFAMWTGLGIIIVMVMTCLMAAILSLCGPFMVLFGQDPVIASQAEKFSYLLIPGIFPYYCYKILVKHLQSQDILLPGALSGVFANGLNIFNNWFFIFYLDKGLFGAPVATTLTRFAEFALMVVYFYWNRRSTLSKMWPVFAPRKLIQKKCSLLKTFFKIASAGALSFSAEAWSFEITTILAGLLGTTALDAHTITLSISTFLYLSFPFAISIAASIKVGHLIGEGCVRDAKLSSLASFILTAVVYLSIIIIILPSSTALGNLFSSSQDVSDMIASLLPISCFFMVGDCIQSTTGGVMRGLGLQKIVFALNVVGFWILGVPIGAILTFVADIGVSGLWWGISIGVYSSALIGLWVLKFRVDWEEAVKKAQDRTNLAGHF